MTGRAKWRSDPELLDRVAASRLTPIAAGLKQEAEEAAVFCFDERRYLLLGAAVVCTIAIEERRDLTHDGLETALDVAQVLGFAREA